MAKLKKSINSFARVPNSLLNNKNITLKAKGLFAFIESKPDGWDFSAKRIAQQLKESIDSISSGLKELEQAGYLMRNRYQAKNSHWRVEYILYESPALDFPDQEIPDQENPVSGKSLNNSNKEYSNKEYSNKELSKYINGNSEIEVSSKIDPEAVEIAIQLHQSVRERYTFVKDRPKEIPDSAHQIDLLHRKDGYDYALIREVMLWSQNDSFWQQNIRSGSKLRAKFQDLLIRIKSERDNQIGKVTVI